MAKIVIEKENRRLALIFMLKERKSKGNGNLTIINRRANAKYTTISTNNGEAVTKMYVFINSCLKIMHLEKKNIGKIRAVILHQYA